MQATSIAEALEEFAFLLELKGDNPFKIRAYQRASQHLKSYEHDLEQFLAEARAGKHKGIGEALVEKIASLYDTGSHPALELLRKEFPSGLFDLLAIPGLGPKKVRVLYKELKIASLEELKHACNENRIAQLKGFGKKSQFAILSSIDKYLSNQKEMLISRGLSLANRLVSHLRDTGLCHRVELSGALRRASERVKQLDLIALTHQAEKVISAFVSLPDIHSVIKRDKLSAAVLLTQGIPATLQIASFHNFGAIMLKTTGNAGHWSMLCELATEKGIALSPAQIADGVDTFASEKSLYNSLGLCFIPPEIRENSGEIEAAAALFVENEDFPQFVSSTDIRGILHVHSTYSDGVCSLKELAYAVREMGYAYLGIADHSRSAVYAGGLSEDAVKKQHDEIDELNETLAPFRLFKGIESEILVDGSLDYSETVLERFDFVIASVHSSFHLSEAEMTKRIIHAIENPFTTILGHPTGRLLCKREAYAVNLDKILEAAAKCGIAIELNANPRRLDLDWRHLRPAVDLGITIPICPDAHSIEAISDIQYGLAIARKGWLEPKNVLNCWALERAVSFFASRKQQNGMK